MHVRDVAAARRLAGRVPVVYLVFDVLYLDGGSLLRTPYSERRAALDGLELDGARVAGAARASAGRARTSRGRASRAWRAWWPSG